MRTGEVRALRTQALEDFAYPNIRMLGRRHAADNARTSQKIIASLYDEIGCPEGDFWRLGLTFVVGVKLKERQDGEGKTVGRVLWADSSLKHVVMECRSGRWRAGDETNVKGLFREEGDG